ncbi:DUF6083 domain-containing protein [Streptomyces sp. NPDC006173]|uniref:DUF6083 domain-containing protein n=1 Tax=Streptomyces sp. NPDC006173 TaxID=3155349 RepID=UPI0033F5C46E
MHPNTDSPQRHWDGSPRTACPRRSQRVTTTSPSRLLRTGRGDRCRRCGHRIDWYQRADQRLIALHPTELDASRIPSPARWHLSSGIAHPHGDGSAWCRIPHLALCPARTPTAPAGQHIESLRRQLAVRTRRLIDTGRFTPAPPTDYEVHADRSQPPRPVVQLLLGRYLADAPLKDLQCVAQNRQRTRCPHPVLHPTLPQGAWTLLPASPQRGQLTLPAALMAIYDLSRLPFTEQLRWRIQRCSVHAAAPGAADLVPAGWQVFDPLLHAAHLHTRLPHTQPSRHGQT